MREILFRGKRTDNDKWVYGNLNILNGCIHHIVPLRVYIYTSGIPASEFYDVVPKSTSQFTGLTDKNGKKIFEGDIIKIAGHTSCYAEVTYSEVSTSYWVENKNLEYFAELGSIKSSFIEVVGNKTDNPELLKNS